MGSTFYLFYMVLFTGGVLWCLFLWLIKDDGDEEGEAGRPEEPSTEVPTSSLSVHSAVDGQSPPSS
jgi:hypothetical protein